MHSHVLNPYKVVVNSTTFFFVPLTFLEIAMRKHYDVTNIFQTKLDAVRYDYTWKDYLACVVMAAAVTVPFIIYIW